MGIFEGVDGASVTVAEATGEIGFGTSAAQKIQFPKKRGQDLRLICISAANVVSTLSPMVMIRSSINALCDLEAASQDAITTPHLLSTNFVSWPS